MKNNKCNKSSICNYSIDGYCAGDLPYCSMCKHVRNDYNSMPCKACIALSSKGTECCFEASKYFNRPIATKANED